MELVPAPPNHVSVSTGYVSAKTSGSKNFPPDRIPTCLPDRISESSEDSENTTRTDIDESFLTLAEKIKARKMRSVPKRKKKSAKKRHSIIANSCEICKDDIGNDGIKCLVDSCPGLAHLICLSNYSTRAEGNHVLPVNVECPNCHMVAKWGDLVRRIKQENKFSVPDPGPGTLNLRFFVKKSLREKLRQKLKIIEK